MGVWDSYQERIQVKGGNKRNAALKREVRYINNRLPDNLSYCTVDIDGASQDVAVINTDILTEKFIHSMPGEDVRRGALVYWMNSYWLVTERDENVTLHTRARMIQCNHLLKWVDDEDIIHEQWCVIEDGTKLPITVSFRVEKSACTNIPLNCWEPLKLFVPQRDTEKVCA